jgi:pyruvate dehydrogenase E1 component alpha subunit
VVIKQYENFYKKMLLIRRFEEKAAQLYGMGKIAGFCHLYIGQEAVVTGMLSAATKDDKHITSYRDHGHMLALDVDPKVIMAELLGKETGCSKGRGGSMHMFDPDRNFYGGHGIVGAQVSIGTGIGLAEQYKGGKGISFVYYGDGAAHQGQVYESFNLAKLWNLPVVYVIENNEYAMGTSVSRSTGQPDLYKRGESFGIPGIQADGMDVLKMADVAEQVVKHVKSGKGPILVEAKTYRYRGHSMSDPATYRSKEEVQEYKEHHDPIDRFKQFLLKNKHASEDQIKNWDKEIKEQVVEAAKFAEESPDPDVKDLFKYVY